MGPETYLDLMGGGFAEGFLEGDFVGDGDLEIFESLDFMPGELESLAFMSVMMIEVGGMNRANK